jgi:ADP-heptose:LPS heptosyltransferase
MPKPKHNVLIIRLSALGDVAMIVPILRALNQNYSSTKITVLTRPFFAPLFRDLKNVTVCFAHVKGEHKGVLGLFALARQLNRENSFSGVADLHRVLRSRILKKFLSCNRFATIDKGRVEKKALISGKIFNQLKTTHQRYADVFEELGYPLDLTKPLFPERAILSKKILSIIGETTKPLIGIAPFAAHEGKMYPLHLMKIVIEELSKTNQIILFGGGKNEILTLNQLEREISNTINLAGKLSLDEELDVISNLDVMLSMDSGNAHLAAMLGVKVVTIWGVTHPFAGFAPFNQPIDYALLADKNKFPKIPTSIYGNKYPENYKDAAGSISPEIIVNKINSII